MALALYQARYSPFVEFGLSPPPPRYASVTIFLSLSLPWKGEEENTALEARAREMAIEASKGSWRKRGVMIGCENKGLEVLMWILPRERGRSGQKAVRRIDGAVSVRNSAMGTGRYVRGCVSLCVWIRDCGVGVNISVSGDGDGDGDGVRLCVVMRSMVAFRMTSAPGMLTAALAATRDCARERRVLGEARSLRWAVESREKGWLETRQTDGLARQVRWVRKHSLVPHSSLLLMSAMTGAKRPFRLSIMDVSL